MKFRTLLFALALATGLVLSACGGNEEAGDGADTTTMEAPATEAPATEAPATTETPAVDSTMTGDSAATGH